MKLLKKLLILVQSLFVAACSSNVQVENAGLILTGFEKNGVNSFSTTVNNNVESFDFTKVVNVSRTATWEVFKDSTLKNAVSKDNATCYEGNNLFFITVSLPDNQYSMYEANIYRLHLYTVTFNPNNGEETYIKKIEENSYVSNDKKHSKKGYVFKGWDYDFSTPVKRNLTINALYNACSYKVTLDVAGGNPLSQTSYTIVYDSPCSFPTPTRVGYSFMGWKLNGNYIGDTWTYDFDATLVAGWRANQYRVVFYDSQEDLNNSKPWSYQYIYYDAAINLPERNRDGLNFEYWMLDGFKFEKKIYDIPNDINLVAFWTSYTVNVSVVGDGETNFYSEPLKASFYSETTDSSAFNEQVLYHGDVLKYPSIPTKKNYLVTGWVDENNNDIQSETELIKSKRYFAQWSHFDTESSYYTEYKTLDLTSKTSYNGEFVQYHKSDVIYFAIYQDQIVSLTVKRSSQLCETKVEIQDYTLSSVIDSKTFSSSTSFSFEAQKSHIYKMTISVADDSAVYKNYSLTFNGSYKPILKACFNGYLNGCSITSGREVELKAYREEGFLGWYDVDGNIVSDSLVYKFIMSKKDVYFTAKWNS